MFRYINFTKPKITLFNHTVWIVIWEEYWLTKCWCWLLEPTCKLGIYTLVIREWGKRDTLCNIPRDNTLAWVPVCSALIPLLATPCHDKLFGNDTEYKEWNVIRNWLDFRLTIGLEEVESQLSTFIRKECNNGLITMTTWGVVKVKSICSVGWRQIHWMFSN